MSDIHQEWKELRQKNGDFINHLDGEMAKLKQDKQLQDLIDAGAFAMQFIAPPQFNCCQDDRDILKALNKAQADRIKYLEDEFLACKEQTRVDQAVKKDLDEKLDKAAAEYKALWVENEDLKSQLAGAKAQCENTVENRRRISELSQEVIDLREQYKDATRQYAASVNEKDRLIKTIHDLEERNSNLRERLANANESLKRSVQRETGFQKKNRFSRTPHAVPGKRNQASADDRRRSEWLLQRLYTAGHAVQDREAGC